MILYLYMEEKELINPSQASILIVEDDPSISYILYTFFSNLPEYSVQLCTNLEEALETLRTPETKLDLLITDRGLRPKDKEDTSGYQVAKEAKGRFPNCQVIMFTGNKALVSRQIREENGIDKVLEKPMKLADIRNEVQQSLESVKNK